MLDIELSIESDSIDSRVIEKSQVESQRMYI